MKPEKMTKAQLNIPLLNLLITQPCREVWRVEFKIKNYNKLKYFFKCLKANYELLQLSRINKSLLCLQPFIENPAGGFRSSSTPPQEAGKLGQTE